MKISFRLWNLKKVHPLAPCAPPPNYIHIWAAPPHILRQSYATASPHQLLRQNYAPDYFKKIVGSFPQFGCLPPTSEVI